MNSVSLLTFCGIIASAILHVALALPVVQAPAGRTPRIAGVWKLNAGKSHLPPARAGALEIRQYRLRPDGFLVGLLVTQDPQGGYHYLQFTAKSDGKDYPEFSDAILADWIAAGRQTPRMYSETIVDDDTTDWIDKANGRITSRGQKIVSKDGRTLTVTVDNSPQTLVYDRQ
ncbi:MAG TPA: hypothetical protein VGK48_12555 [Terriglobia bacterium]|jgi:hypothetical protein